MVDELGCESDSDRDGVLDGIDEPTMRLIETSAARVPGVEHVSDARARWVGHELRAELAIDVTPEISVEAGHEIGELVRASLLRESTELVGRFDFAHALINHTLYQGLGVTRRARLHQRLVAAAAAVFGVVAIAAAVAAFMATRSEVRASRNFEIAVAQAGGTDLTVTAAWSASRGQLPGAADLSRRLRDRGVGVPELIR